MRRKGSVVESVDWLTIGFYFLIVLFGWFTIYAVQFQPGESSGFDLSDIYGRQLIWIAISILVGFIILIFDTEFFTSFAMLLYALLILLLILTFFIAKEVNGARSWLEFGSVKIQPAEFAKYATALAMAKFLSMTGVSMKKMQDRLIAFGIMGLPMGLIILQDDLGSALVFGSFVLVLYREGFSAAIVLGGAYMGVLSLLSLIVPHTTLLSVLAAICLIVIYFGLGRYFKRFRAQTVPLFAFTAAAFAALLLVIFLTDSVLISAITAIVLTAALWFGSGVLKRDRNLVFLPVILLFGSIFYAHFLTDFVLNDVIESHQRTRILSLVGQIDDKDANYNVNQSKITIASGGFSGKGYLNGTLTQHGHVPEQQTDFIFCTIGEEFGFLGSATLLLLYLGLLVRIIYLAERQRSAFSRVYAYSVAAIFFIQVAINVGMTMGLAPVIGIPLPFVSYGGSSVLAFTILLFTMIRLDADRLLVLR